MLYSFTDAVQTGTYPHIHISFHRYIEVLTKHKTEKLTWENGVAEHSFAFT